MIMTLINYVYSCRPGPMRPGGFVDLCEHCTKILDERNLESEEYIKKKKKKKKKSALSITLIWLINFI